MNHLNSQAMNNIEPVSQEEADRALRHLAIKDQIRKKTYETPEKLEKALDNLADDLIGEMPGPTWGSTDPNAGPDAKGRAHTPSSLN